MPVYAMENGLVVMQAEDGNFVDPSNPENSNWTLDRSFADDNGDGVILWDGSDYFGAHNAGQPQTAPLRYDFEVTEAGTYFVSLRAIRPVTGEPGDRNNDFFVQFEDQGYNKVFFSGARETFQFGKTIDVNHNFRDSKYEITDEMIAENGGVFSLFVAGRSHKAGLDQIHIQKDSFNLNHDAETSAVLSDVPDAPPADDAMEESPASSASEPNESAGFFADLFNWIFSFFGLFGGSDDQSNQASATLSVEPDVILSDLIPSTGVLAELDQTPELDLDADAELDAA